MDSFRIQQVIDRGEREALRRLDPGEVGEFLWRLFEENAVTAGAANIDRLISVGVSLGLAALNDADRVAIEWLDEEPTATRLDVASPFLEGIWGHLPHFGAAQSDRAFHLLGIAEQLPMDSEIRYGVLRALSAAVRDETEPATRERLRQFLSAAANEDFGPALQPLVRALVARALQQANAPM